MAYERHLDADPGWAMEEGSRHFEEKSAVHVALRKIAGRLDELGIPYAISGGMALFAHGVRRFTEDVDILVTKEGLRSIHASLAGLGYVHAFPGSKNLRDSELGVRIEFLIAGQYPGDGKPKPVRFPEPQAVASEWNGIKVLGLDALVELKLASGSSSPDRTKDLADVQELIKVLRLPEGFAERLDPSVRGEYARLWTAARAGKRYMMLWRNKLLTTDTKSLDGMITSLRQAAETLESMQADGVILDSGRGPGDDFACLVTTDPDVARKYDMQDEREFWSDEDGH